MWTDHLRAWLTPGPATSEEETGEDEDLDAQSAEVREPKPLLAAVVDALAAVGDLVVSLKANSKGHGKKKGERKSRRRRSASGSAAASKASANSTPHARARRRPRRATGEVGAEAVRIEPTSARARGSRSSGRPTRIVVETPVILAPERVTTFPSKEEARLA